jgi:hypothetical protein
MADNGYASADAITDADLAAARLDLVLEGLAPTLKAVSEGEADVEGKARDMQARFETLQGDIGRHLEGPLLQLLEWVDDLFVGLSVVTPGVDALGKAIGGAADFAAEALGPFARLADLIGDVGEALGIAGGGGGSRRLVSPMGPFGPSFSVPAKSVTVNINGGDPVEVERETARALRGISGRNGLVPGPLGGL